MQYTFHPIESQIVDLLFFPQGVDFSSHKKECLNFEECNEYAPESLTEEFQRIEASLKPYENRIHRFYYETYSLPRLLLKNYSPFGHSSPDSYLEHLGKEAEQDLLTCIVSKLYLDIKEERTINDIAIQRVTQDIHEQMNLIDSLETSPEEKWKLANLIRNPKAMIREWLDLLHELMPLFSDYYNGKKEQVEQFGLKLSKQINETDGNALVGLSNGMLNKLLMPSGRILVSCIEPIRIVIYYSPSTPFVLWGLEMQAFIQYLQTTRESELRERINHFKNLGDKTRYEVVRLIAQGVDSAKTIATTLGVSQPTISYHINNLLTSKIILLERVDQKYVYKVNFEILEKTYLNMLHDFGKS